MICLYSQSQLYTFTLIVYTCICLPLLQITHTILTFLTYLLNPHQLPKTKETQLELDLPVSTFRDSENEEETCSICLNEFENGDLVNKLPICGHLFHMECMEKWLDRCQYTCPLCRSLVLHVSSSPCKMWESSSDFCDLSPVNDS